MRKTNNKLDFRVNGVNVIWTNSCYSAHYKKHPEIRNETYLKMIIDTRMNPDFVYVSHNNPDVMCYYMKSFTLENVQHYFKVMIDEGVHPNRILTSFRVDNIKESKYGGPRYEK